MPEDQLMFRVLFRRPHYPVIIISADRLRVAYDLLALGRACLRSTPLEGKTQVSIIDASASEFEYNPETLSVIPSFYIMKPWSKKRMVDLYNQSVNAQELGGYYSDRSLNNKPVSRVTADLCDLIKRSNRGKDR